MPGINSRICTAGWAFRDRMWFTRNSSPSFMQIDNGSGSSVNHVLNFKDVSSKLNFDDRARAAAERNPLERNKNISITGSTATLRSLLARTIFGGFLGIIVFFALFYIASSPPLHWFYERGDFAGPASVYLPGGGFSGFWFHLGYLHSFSKRHDLHDYDYYCFSASCLSIISVFLNRSLEEVYDSALTSQNAWKSGNRSRFEIVEHFFDELFPPEDDESKERESWLQTEGQNNKDDPSLNLNISDGPNFLPRLKILVTTLSDSSGYKIVKPQNRKELKENILRTTWIPYVTGWGFRMPASGERDANDIVYLDGAFSRNVHPECEVKWDLPFMWETLVHTFSAGLSHEELRGLWNKGRKHEYPLPKFSRNTAAIQTERVTMMRGRSSPLGDNRTISIPSGPRSENSVNDNGYCLPPSSIPA